MSLSHSCNPRGDFVFVNGDSLRVVGNLWEMEGDVIGGGSQIQVQFLGLGGGYMGAYLPNYSLNCTFLAYAVCVCV